MWQDKLFFGGNIGFAVALIFSIVARTPPALETSVMTGSIIGAFAVAFFKQGQRWAGIGSCITTSLWFVLASMAGG